MRVALAIVLATLPLAAGCLTEPGPALDLHGEPQEGPCGEGVGSLFFRATNGGGFVPPDYMADRYSIDRDGDFFRVAGSQREGSGHVTARDGALHNLTEADVKAEMQRLGAYSPDRDYEVSLAYRAALTNAEFNGFCGVVLDRFYGLAAHHDDPNCMDGGTLNMTASTERGTHTSAAYCGGGSRDFHAVREAFVALDEAARERAGVPQPGS